MIQLTVLLPPDGDVKRRGQSQESRNWRCTAATERQTKDCQMSMNNAHSFLETSVRWSIFGTPFK